LPQRYVVAVGSLEPRKNLARIIRAWQTLGAKREGVSLLIVGAANKNVFAEMQIPDDPSIQVHGYVADEDLPLIYGLAEVCVYCSIYEGFGLPVLEAMASGTPVVCSENTSVPEAAGGAAVLVDPLDAASIAEGIRCLLGASALGDDLRQRGLERARGLTWDRTAEQTWEVLEAAALDG
jgi:glycosyltransferase involved in cell wall biosynthesis